MKYSWQEYQQDVVKLAEMITCNPDSVYGIPRGGLVLAVSLSHLLLIPLILREEDIKKRTLICDDIADTGKTLSRFNDHVIATLFYHKQSLVIPVYWIREKKDQWIVFPWETKEKGETNGR